MPRVCSACRLQPIELSSAHSARCRACARVTVAGIRVASSCGQDVPRVASSQEGSSVGCRRSFRFGLAGERSSTAGDTEASPLLGFLPCRGVLESPAAFSDDIRNLFDALRRRAWLFLLVFVPVVALAVAWVYLSRPLFTATATIVIDPRKQVVTDSPEVLPDMTADSAVIDTQVQLILSRTVLGGAVDRLALTTLASDEGGIGKSLAGVAQWLGAPSPTAPTLIEPVLTRAQLIDALLKNLTVQRMGLTSAIAVSYTAAQADEAAQITNAIAASYIEYQAGIKQQATKDANQWLRQRVEELGRQLRSAQSAVDAYRSRSGLLTAKGATSTESQLTSLDTGLDVARQSLSEAEARLASYRSALRVSGAAEAARVVSSGHAAAAHAISDAHRSACADVDDVRGQASADAGAQSSG